MNFSVTFFLATGLTTLVFVMDKKMGLLDRCLASGTLDGSQTIRFPVLVQHIFMDFLYSHLS